MQWGDIFVCLFVCFLFWAGVRPLPTGSPQNLSSNRQKLEGLWGARLKGERGLCPPISMHVLFPLPLLPHPVRTNLLIRMGEEMILRSSTETENWHVMQTTHCIANGHKPPQDHSSRDTFCLPISCHPENQSWTGLCQREGGTKDKPCCLPPHHHPKIS